MKKKLVPALLLLALLLSVAAGALYKRPVTLEQLCPELELDSCTGITACYTVDTQNAKPAWEPVLIAPDSKEFDLLMEQLRHPEFRKSFRKLLPSGAKKHPFKEGDFRWELALEFDEPTVMAGGSTASGTLIRLTNFYGDLTIENIYGDQSIQCGTKNQQQWAEAILSILSSKSSQTVKRPLT